MTAWVQAESDESRTVSALVVGEVARLLLVGERVAEDVQREHEVGLLDDLLAVEVEVGEVQEQRVLLGLGVLEVPDLVAGEALGLRVDAERLVPRDDHVVRGVAPGGRLLEVGAERCRVAGMARDRIGGGAQVPLREQVGVDVVVGDRAVLVRAGDAVDAEAALRVVVAERAPEPRGLDEQLEPDLALELLVAGRAAGSGRRRRRCRAPMWNAAVPAGQ